MIRVTADQLTAGSTEPWLPQIALRRPRRSCSRRLARGPGAATSARTRSGRARPPAAPSRTPRGGRRGAARAASASASNVARSCGGTVRRIATSRDSRSRSASSGSDLGGQHRAPSPRRARACRARAPSCRSRSVRRPCANASGNDTTSTRAVRILEREDRHAVALARLQLPDAGDDAADGHVARPGAGCAVRPRRRGDVAERSRAPMAASSAAKRSIGWPLR